MQQQFFYSIGLIICVVGFIRGNDDESETKYWQKLGTEALKDSLKMINHNKVVKNVIFFLGDGMGPSTVTAMRHYKGQKSNNTNDLLSFDKFPYVSLSKTYALDRMVPDSANTATAFFCGVKTNMGTLGVNGKVKLNDCKTSLESSARVSSVLEWAQNDYKRTGFVTTKRVTDATPAALYCHSANRQWEASAPKECKDIAAQLIQDKPGKNINVIFGGGRGTFIPNTKTDNTSIPGMRTDKRDLIEDWKTDKKNREVKAEYVYDYTSFSQLSGSEVDYALGLFNSSHLPFVLDRPGSEKTPTLVEMTKKAIEILQKSPTGYFLAVEGAQIDSGHHMNSARKALEEGLEFDAAIEVALQMADMNDTLIIVTADHSHPLTISGNYPLRNSDILGLGGYSNITYLDMTILSYSNGAAYNRTTNLTKSAVGQNNYKYEATYPMTSETHSGEDVAVYAIGPMAHLFHGVYEQSYIPYAIGYAACIGRDSFSYDRCRILSSASTAKFEWRICVLALVLMYLYRHVFCQ